MNLIFWVVLLLPVILNITGNVAVLVFLAMNSLLCWLMQYTKIQIGIAASIAKYEDRIDELKDDDVSFEDAFNEYMENVNLDDADTYTPGYWGQTPTALKW